MKKKEIPLAEPIIYKKTWAYIKDCLNSGWVASGGKYVCEFEEAVARYVGNKYGIATTNATSYLAILKQHLVSLKCNIFLSLLILKEKMLFFI